VVIGNENGKVNLSIKRLEAKPQRENTQRGNGNFRPNNGPRRDAGFNPQQSQPQPRPQRAPVQTAAPKTADQLFEEKLKAFMSESDTKLSSIRADHRTKSRRR
jgi:predicted RNA-binding protein with RPS1 domain